MTEKLSPVGALLQQLAVNLIRNTANHAQALETDLDALLAIFPGTEKAEIARYADAVSAIRKRMEGIVEGLEHG